MQHAYSSRETQAEATTTTKQHPSRNDASHPVAPALARNPLWAQLTYGNQLPASLRLSPEPVQRKQNTTGLPDTLKTGIENLSGLSMDDVQVHYQSSKPARVQALAYTQGTDIHVAPGQEQHLAHEAWHVVQQKQGRVEPTRQLYKVAVNDDAGLELEADAMGNMALQQANTHDKEGITHAVPDMQEHRAGQRLSPFAPLQRKMRDKLSDDVPTPAFAIATSLGLAANKLKLPGGTKQPSNTKQRPRQVEAEVSAKSLRKGDRADSGATSTVTSMARAEQFILQGADLQKFFDAGHLVADQLVADEGSSFVYWNLAPQVSSFNTPTYANIMEEEVKAVAAQGETVEVQVTVEYPDGGTYTVRVQDIVARGVVSAFPDKPGYVNIGNVENGYGTFPVSKLDESISIPRRIPNRWYISATIPNPVTTVFPQIAKDADRGKMGENFVPDLTPVQPSIGTPFSFVINDARRIDAQLVILKNQTRTLIAKQWVPSTGGIRETDIASLVLNTFPDLRASENIIGALGGTPSPIKQTLLIFEIGGKIQSGLQSALRDMVEVADTTLLQGLVNEYNGQIATRLTGAMTAMTNSQFKGALEFLVSAQSLVEILREKIADAKQEQRANFMLPLTTTLNMYRSFTQLPPQPTPVPSLEFDFSSRNPWQQSSLAYPVPIQAFTGPQYERVYTSTEGGEIRFFHMGSPNVRPGEFIRVNTGETRGPDESIVTVVKVFTETEQETTMPNGIWHITYRHGLR